MLHLTSQIGLVVSAVYLVVTLAAVHRNRGHIRFLSGAAGIFFAIACVLYLAGQNVQLDLSVTLAGLGTLMIPVILIHPRRLIEKGSAS